MVRRGLTFQSASEGDRDWSQDPVGYVREVLHVEPWAKQVEICQSVCHHKRVAVRSCHNSGKSEAAAWLVLWALNCFEPSLVITTAPTLRQVKEVLWNRIGRLHRRANLPGVINTQDLTISPTRRAFGFTTNEPERFQGHHEANIWVIIDEASGVGETIYEAIEGLLTTENAHLLLIGNPNFAQGTFYEAFKSPLYHKIHIGADEVPAHILPPTWKEERLKVWGAENPAYQIRVLGNFPPQGANALISLTWVEAAEDRDLPAGEPCEIGVDVAYHGDDQSVAIVRKGSKVVAIDDWRGHDTVETAGRVAALAQQYQPCLIKVDHIGYGAGALDTLKHEGFPAIGINVGEAAWDSEKYANRRAELFFGLAERFQQGDIDVPVHDYLSSQLTALTFSYTPRGQLKLISKVDMKKERVGNYTWQSPDFADALMLAYAKPAGGYQAVSLLGAERPSGGFRWKE